MIKAENISKETPNIEFEQDWSVCLGPKLRDKQKIKKLFFKYQGFYREKP